MVVERGNQTDPLRAMAGFLAPARFSLRTPAVRTRFMIIPPCLIQIHALFRENWRHLLAKLFPQRFVSLSIPEGLFLCV